MLTVIQICDIQTIDVVLMYFIVQAGCKHTVQLSYARFTLRFIHYIIHVFCAFQDNGSMYDEEDEILVVEQIERSIDDPAQDPNMGKQKLL